MPQWRCPSASTTTTHDRTMLCPWLLAWPAGGVIGQVGEGMGEEEMDNLREVGVDDLLVGGHLHIVI